VHAVVALALPAVEAFDLAIPAQVFGDHRQAKLYRFTVCAPAAGLVPATTGYAIEVEHGLEALAAADTIVVPGSCPCMIRGTRSVRRCARRLQCPLAGGRQAFPRLESTDLPVEDIAARCGLGTNVRVSGHVYDVETGVVTTVVDATSKQHANSRA